MINKSRKSVLKILLVLGVIVFFIVIFLYLGIRSWITNNMALAYDRCKNTVSQDIYKEMNTYPKNTRGEITDPNAISPLLSAKEKIVDCTIDKSAEKFSFLGKEAVETIKARVRMDLELGNLK